MQENGQDIADPIEKQMKDEAVEVFRRIVSEVTETPEFKKVKNASINKALSSWAGENVFENMDGSRMSEKISQEFKDAESAPKTKIEDLELWGNIGKLITLGARYVAQKDKTDSDRIANLLAKPLKELLMNTDFGHIYEMVAASEDRIMATQRMIQDVMGQFPTKSGIFPAIKFKKANTSLKKRNLALKNMEKLPPEMLLSSMINLFNELIEPEALGVLIHQISELIRKIHAGSVILGEAGKPMIEMSLTNKLRDALAQVDPVVFGKAFVALMEEVEGVSSAIMTATSEEPEIIGKIVTSYGARKNSKIRRIRKKADILEELVDEGDGSRLIGQGLADLDTQEVGETVNAWLRIINSIHDSQPDVALTPVSSLFSVIDWDELQTAAQWLVPDLIESIKPLAGAVMPSLINGLCELLTPIPGDDSDQLDEALANLRSILSSNGGGTI